MLHIPISLVFACGIDGQDIKYPTRKSWGFVIHLESDFLESPPIYVQRALILGCDLVEILNEYFQQQ
ncbi:hypothetical protein [Nostoc sp.]|uniref:hypothetical protein n=1 Tax=Nostoc sp. TaxID=1180 RepID=UPI002FFB1784